MTDAIENLIHSLPTNGWLTMDEGKLLYKSASKGKKAILEVGSYYGRSTCLLASFGREVYSVDPFNNFDSGDLQGDIIEEAFCNNISDRGIKNVWQCRCRIEDWAWTSILTGRPRYFDFAYLDGDHTYQGTCSQIEVAKSIDIRLLCVHDILSESIKSAVINSGLNILQTVERMAYCCF